MTIRHSPGRMEFDFLHGGAKGQPNGDTPPFHILILGDFSGRESRGLREGNLASRRPVKVDLDTLDQTIARMGAQIHLPIGGDTTRLLPVKIAKLDDFHPDSLFTTSPMFATLQQLHAQLKDPATFPTAAANVRALLGLPTPAGTAPTAAPEPAASGDPLADMLSRPRASAQKQQESAADAFIRSVVQPHMLNAPDPQQAELLKLLEEALGAGMRAILHHPAFQALEAAWRSVHFLASRLNTDTDLKLLLLDVTKAELAADLASSADLEQTGLYKLLVEQTVNTPGGIPYAIVVGNYTFDPTAEDLKTLAVLATIAQAATAPFIAAAAPALVGTPSFATEPDPINWHRPPTGDFFDKIRELDQATSLCLAAPRFLLRLPYGLDTDATEKYHFTEMPAPLSGQPDHDAYLWANPAFLVALALGEAFLEDGWSMTIPEYLEISDLPAHTYDDAGQRAMTPCAEAYLTDRAAQAILQTGITPVLSIKNRPAARVLNLASVANGNKPLAGRWGQ